MSRARRVLVTSVGLAAVLFVTLAIWTPHPWRCLLTALVLGVADMGVADLDGEG